MLVSSISWSKEHFKRLRLFFLTNHNYITYKFHYNFAPGRYTRSWRRENYYDCTIEIMLIPHAFPEGRSAKFARPINSTRSFARFLARESAHLFIASVANFVPNTEFYISSYIYENGTRCRRHGGNMVICLILINELTFVRNCGEIQMHLTQNYSTQVRKKH